MPRMKLSRLAVVAAHSFFFMGCSASSDRSDSPEIPSASPSAATVETQASPPAESPQEAAMMPGIPGGPSFKPAGDRAAQAEEIRGFLGEIRPLAAGCSGSVTIRSLVMYGSGSETQMMRLPPAPRPCEALTAEIKLWESRLASIEAGS